MFGGEPRAQQIDPLRTLADASVGFAYACEKIDHMEDFLLIVRKATGTLWLAFVCNWGKSCFKVHEIEKRRKELAIDILHGSENR